jgi:hypothetical protein
MNTRRLGGLWLGVLLAIVNGVAWAVSLRTAAPLSAELPGVYAPPPKPVESSENRVVINLDTCADCPAYALLDRGILSPWAPWYRKLLWAANLPGLSAAADGTLRYQVRVVRPRLFFILASLQWIVVGWLGYAVAAKLRGRSPTRVPDAASRTST